MLDGCAEQRFVVGRRGEAELELGLHECNRVCVRGELHCVELRDRVREAQVRQVDGDDIDRIRNDLAVQLGEIDALEVDDAGGLAQRAEQLPVPGVDGVHAPRPCVQQHAGEPSGRGPGIERDSAGHGDVERIERGLQLRLAAERLVSSERDRRARTDERGSIGHDSAVDDDRASRDRRIGIGDGWVCAHELVAEPAQRHTAFPGHVGLLSSLGLWPSDGRRRTRALGTAGGCVALHLDEAGHGGILGRAAERLAQRPGPRGFGYAGVGSRCLRKWTTLPDR
jgi:hypothetical protein